MTSSLASWRRPFASALAVIFLYGILGVSLAATRRPHSDEGNFANAAYNVAYLGKLNMPMWRAWTPGLEERVYVTMPLYFLLGGAWFHVVEPGLVGLRTMSVAAGAAALLGFFFFFRRTEPASPLLAVLATVVVGIHYDYINLTNTRYDGVAAMFNVGSWIVYVLLRERNLGWAILAANACLAASAVTHPYAIFGLFALAIFVWTLDRRRLRLVHLLWAGAPYVVSFGLWGLYILQDVEDFRRQMGANVGGRLSTFSNPAAALRDEIVQRYVLRFAGWHAQAPAVMRTKALLLPFYLVAYAGCWMTPSIRGNPYYRAILLYVPVGFLGLAVLEGSRQYNYLVHVIPYLLLCATLWLWSEMRRGGWRRRAAGGAVAAMVVFSLASIGYRVRLNEHGKLLVPTANYLNSVLQPGELVMCPGHVGAMIGYERHALVDFRLGFQSGERPDYVVLDPEMESNLAANSRRSPEERAHIANVLARGRTVFEVGDGRYYKVLRIEADRE